MARPDFTKTWASSRPSIPLISDPDYALGFANYLGAIPPSTDDHDYIMNLQDQRSVWLANSQLDSVRIDVASSANVNLTNLAPDTRHINITGTTTITGFSIEPGRAYFVKFSGALTISNNASIVTQSGSSISTSAGDTCIIRSISSNTVEILSYMPAGGWANILSSNGYQKFPSGLILQWGSATTGANGGAQFNYPISFPTTPVNASVITTRAGAGLAGFYSALQADSVNNTSCIAWANSATAGIVLYFIILGK